jgi:hypothetical protein
LHGTPCLMHVRSTLIIQWGNFSAPCQPSRQERNGELLQDIAAELRLSYTVDEVKEVLPGTSRHFIEYWAAEIQNPRPKGRKRSLHFALSAVSTMCFASQALTGVHETTNSCKWIKYTWRQSSGCSPNSIRCKRWTSMPRR